MRISKQTVAALVFILAAVICPAQTQTIPPAKKAVDKEVKILLRTDLLQPRKQEESPPKRNIFAPRMGFSRPGAVAVSGRPLPPVDFEAADESAPAGETGEAPPVITINLRYLGFIGSPRGLVALVNFEGRAIAVAEGDVVGDGIRIGKVTREQIEVILPDSSTRIFPLEGE